MALKEGTDFINFEGINRDMTTDWAVGLKSQMTPSFESRVLGK